MLFHTLSRLARYITVLASCLCVISLAGCGPAADVPDDGKLKVAVTFDALKEFTQAVGGDKVDVYTLIPDGTEPHEFQPTTQTIKHLGKSQLFVYSGLGMEPWAPKVVEAAKNTALHTVNASQGVTPIALTDKEDIKEHGAYDPHIWLSLVNAQIEVSNIAAALAEADPANADYYRNNAGNYKKQLQSLQDEYARKFASVPRKDFVTGHAAFAYLCRDFGLTQHSVESVFSSGEPSARQLARLADYCRANDVRTIFVEDMVSPKTSETLAREVGARVETIHTIETSEDDESYLDRMRDNLEKIYASSLY